MRKKYIVNSPDPFLAFIELINRTYDVEKTKSALVTDTHIPKITENISSEPKEKKQRIVLGEVQHNSSLDDFVL